MVTVIFVGGRRGGPDTDQTYTGAFATRSETGRHQFRFIVSPEDASDLGDLRDFTRELMKQVQKI